MSYRACRKGSEEHVEQGLSKCLINPAIAKGGFLLQMQTRELREVR